LGLALLVRRTTRARATAIAAALAMATAVELAAVPWPAFAAVPVPAAYRTLAALPPGTVAEFPFFWLPSDAYRHSVYMLQSTAHWHPLMNGYSDHIPSDFTEVTVAVSTFPSWEAFGILRRHGVRYVVFHSNYYDRRSWVKLLERIRRYEAFLSPVVRQGDVWLYEIVEWPA
jgi:hypothetical protein